MPLTQGCILMGFQAADENVTLLVLLGFLSASDLIEFASLMSSISREFAHIQK